MIEEMEKQQYLTFELADGYYGIALEHISEIVGLQKITEVPTMPDYVKGIMNLRGKIIPIMDVRVRFGLEEIAYNERTCVIVLVVNDMELGIIVDCVSEVIRASREELIIPPRNDAKYNEYIESIVMKDGEPKLVVNSYKLI